MFIYDDNFLTEEEIIEIDKNYFSPEKSWTYFPGTQSEPGHEYKFEEGNSMVDFPVKDVAYFSCFQIGNTEGIKYNHKVSPIFISLIDKFCKKHKIEYSKVIRMKFNMTLRSDYDSHMYPHVDDMNDHYVFLYYVNDSDGDTFVFNEKAELSKKFEYKDLTLMKKITPKKGAAILMDGKHFHAISAPTKTNLRCVINVNLQY